MNIVLASCGKSQALSSQSNADLFIDCRGMVNPYRDPVLGGLTGDHLAVQEWIKQKNPSYVNAIMLMIMTAILSAPTRNSFSRNPNKPLTVCFFCMAGVHRSRGMKHVIASLLQDTTNHKVEVV